MKNHLSKSPHAEKLLDGWHSSAPCRHLTSPEMSVLFCTMERQVRDTKFAPCQRAPQHISRAHIQCFIDLQIPRTWCMRRWRLRGIWGSTCTSRYDSIMMKGSPATSLALSLHGSSHQCCLVTQVEQPLQPPNAQFLTSLMNLPKGGGRSDFIDAVTVAADSINRATQARPELEKANVSKEIVLISNFHEKIREEDIQDFVQALVESLQSKGVSTHP